MAEEDAEKKKPGIIRRVLKYIGLGLLSLVLVAAVFFQAPWKVITLLVVVLLACTVLPKPGRKWFWISVGAVVIGLVVWVLLPDSDSGDWRLFTFDEEVAALEARRAIPDSENAAIIYNQLLDNYQEDACEPNFVDDDRYDITASEPWASEDHPEIAEWLKAQQGTIDGLLQACEIEECRFPIAADIWSLNGSMDRLPQMRSWARLLARAGNNDIGEGRIDAGLEKYMAVVQMAEHLHQQPTMVDLLVGVACEAIALKQFNRFVVTGNATEENLRFIQETLAKNKHTWSSDFTGILDCEKLMFKNLCAICYETNDKGKVRLTRDATAAMRAQVPQDAPQLTYWQKKLMRASTILLWFYMPSTPQKLGKIIDASYEKLYAMAEPAFHWEKEVKEIPPTSLFSTRFRFNYRCLIELLVAMTGKSYYGIHDLYTRCMVGRRSSRVIIALRRYKNEKGNWPESLDDVKGLAPAEIFVDPINNGCFVYKLADDGFTLYSKGKNNIDEGGLRNCKEGGTDDWQIWPRKSRRAEKADENNEG